MKMPFTELRKRAEKILEERADGGGGPPDLDLLHLLHELEVHQVELELQNEELRRTWKQLEDSRNLYFDLYDSAPVGFVAVNRTGLITQFNRAAEEMLAGPDDRLLGEAFSRRIDPATTTSIDPS